MHSELGPKAGSKSFGQQNFAAQSQLIHPGKTSSRLSSKNANGCHRGLIYPRLKRNASSRHSRLLPMPPAMRLMLARVGHQVRTLKGTYAMEDTDSMAIVATEHGGLVPCPGGAHRTPEGREAIKALTWKQVRDISKRFGFLNPYSGEAGRDSI